MGKLIGAAVSIGMLFLTMQPAKADTTTVERLAKNCAIAVKMERTKKWPHPDNKIGDAAARGHCFGFLEAARQAAPTPIKSVMGGACFTNNPSNEELAEMFVVFAYEHQQDVNLPAIGEVFFAFESKYPCSHKN